MEMFDRKLYAELESATVELCAGKRLPDGQPELFALASGFDSVFRRRGDDGVHEQLLAWRKDHPRSISAALAEAKYWSLNAWKARGNGYARSVPPEAWELFHERIAKSADVLKQTSSFASACPLWHSMHIDTLLDQGAERSVIEQAYASAVKRFPHSQQIHVSMGRVQSSRWGGSAAAFEQFARRAAQLSKDSEGFGMYARLYWGEDCDCETAFVFDDDHTVPTWPALKTAFNDLLKRYPADLWNRNKFAALACRAGDGETYTALRRYIGKHIYPQQWHSSYSPEVCDRRFYKKA